MAPPTKPPVWPQFSSRSANISRRVTVLLVLTISLCATQVVAQGTTTARAIQVGGLQRTYRVHVASARRSARVPLVFVLHGGGGTGAQMERFVAFSALADRHGFIVVYPEAIERNWNDGRNAGSIRTQREGIDDVAFFSAMLERLSKEFRVDPNRVYATGISNGGFMSQLLAVRLSDRISAIAAVAAGMAPAVAGNFYPKEPVSVLIINGTEDRLVPFHGGDVARSRGKTIATDEIIKKWATRNRCAKGPATASLRDVDASDGTRILETTYTQCARGTEVVLYTIKGGGHTWPGGSQYLSRAIVGRVSRDLDATSVIWEFFTRHPRQ